MSQVHELMDACLDGDLAEVERLLAAGVNPADADYEALGRAVVFGHPDIVQLLLEDGRVDPAADGNWALRVAIEHNHPEVVSRLLDDPRTRPEINDNEHLDRAMWWGYLEVVERLLRDNRVGIPLQTIYDAAGRGRAATLERLLGDYRVVARTVDVAELEAYAERSGDQETADVVRRWIE